VAIIYDLELIGYECRLELSANQRDASGGHGCTCTTGLMSTAPNTPSST
jgi:hypothetical protein